VNAQKRSEKNCVRYELLLCAVTKVCGEIIRVLVNSDDSSVTNKAL
jgi:hypothetical protein